MQTNYSTAVMLFNKNIRAVATSYELDDKGNGVKPFKIYKTMMADLKVGDLVIIPTKTRHGATIVRVEQLNPEIDFESSTQIEWLVGKVDMSEYQNVVANEAKMISFMKEAEKNRKENELRDSMKEFYNGANLEQLAQLTGPVVEGTATAEKPATQ